MPERSQIIATSAAFIPADSDTRQDFTVDTTAGVLDVALNASINPDVGLLKDATGSTWLRQKDNFNILSIGTFLPYSFGFSSQICGFQITWRDNAGVPNTGSFNIGDAAGNFWLPFPSYEMALGIFCAWPAAAVGSIQLFAKLFQPVTPLQARISMVGAPAILDTEVLPITTWIKLSQNSFFYGAP